MIYEFDSVDIPLLDKPVPYMSLYENNPCLGKTCAFSDPTTWGDDGVPTAPPNRQKTLPFLG